MTSFQQGRYRYGVDGFWHSGSIQGPSGGHQALPAYARMSGSALTSPGGSTTPPPSSGSRDLLVYGDYAPGLATTGPVSGTTFTVLGTGPSYLGRAISDYDDPNCPYGVVANAADWSNGTDYRLNCTSSGQVIENVELWGSIDLNGKSNVTIRNCIIHGDQARTGAISPIINSSAGDDLLGLTLIDSKVVGRPIRIPDTYNGVALDAAGLIDACNQYSNGMRGGNANIYRCEFVRLPDGIGLTSTLGQWNIAGNWIHRHAYVEWTFHDSASGPGGWYPTTKQTAGNPNPSHYTHADCIQFHRGKHIRIWGNTLGNYLGGGCSGSYTHNATEFSPPRPSDRDKILACEDFYNSNFMIFQEVSSNLVDQIQDVVIHNNFLGGGVSTINWPSNVGVVSTSPNPNSNPWPKRKVQDNWDDYTDIGIGVWHNRVRPDNGSPLEYLVYSTLLDRIVDDERTDGTPYKYTRSG